MRDIETESKEIDNERVNERDRDKEQRERQ